MGPLKPKGGIFSCALVPAHEFVQFCMFLQKVRLRVACGLCVSYGWMAVTGSWTSHDPCWCVQYVYIWCSVCLYATVTVCVGVKVCVYSLWPQICFFTSRKGREESCMLCPSLELHCHVGQQSRRASGFRSDLENIPNLWGCTSHRRQVCVCVCISVISLSSCLLT